MSAGKSDLETLRILLESARDLLAELADGATQRAVHALHVIPPDERSALTTALERAAETWRQNEAFAPLNQVHLRANPRAQLFVRVFDPVAEPPGEDFDLLPEAVRVMQRMGVLMRPEPRAIWERAVTEALGVLTPEERAETVRFLERALTLVTGTSALDEGATDDCDPGRKSAHGRAKG